ncbi:MAG: MOSC domain-containing protein [Anaerolineae bacterium]|nr:MOSC domain-containing protein [Anaerolineae bacterium]
MAHIFQINRSSGGVPKLGISKAEIRTEGVSDDWQNDQVHHGGPDRAVCLYSLELILALQAEGHPVFPGALGENLTIAGLSWPEITPGVVLQLGEATHLEVVAYTTPCSHIRPFFHDHNSNRIHQKTHPGWSRVYARVLQSGEIQVGDKVTLLKEPAHDKY